jgi:hypothetical protein
MAAVLDEEKLAQYLAEMRATVCSRCIERPPGGPPCAPLGKICGIELHLAQIVDAVHHVRSNWVGDYLQNNRAEICERCAYHHSDLCPCPMDYLAALVVEAVEAVDGRHHADGLPEIGFDTVI